MGPIQNTSTNQRTNSFQNSNSFHPNNRSNQQRVQCQLCDKFEHIAKVCRSKSHSALEGQANFTNRLSYASNPTNNWIVDSGASHHITNNSQSLQATTEFPGTDEIIVGEGKTIPITHIGHTTLSSSHNSFKLRNDLSTGACLLQGRSKGDLYEWPPISVSPPSLQANFATQSPKHLHFPSLDRASASNLESWHCPVASSSSISLPYTNESCIPPPIPQAIDLVVPRTTQEITTSPTTAEDVSSSTAVCTSANSPSPSTPSMSNTMSPVAQYPFPPPQTLPPAPTHSMVMRSQNNIFKPKVVFDYLAISSTKSLPLAPTTFAQANKYPEWKTSMKDEYTALMRNSTWTLVPPYPSQNVVGFKWVYRVQHKPDGSVDRYKARLVANVFINDLV
ncbi:PREDICTED: mucin-5AC-like [Nicotiana attenuata]|uniref:mucin-5AC-like n=1 Tax=Nicotiana attenuata TaxID=49451 RepID=UPI000904E95C|nr:PREDICTED: mucin-5AC-like [Nicotiana attenuata]